MQAKLGFIKHQNLGDVSRAGSNRHPSRNRRPKGSFDLSPPEKIIFCPRLLRFNALESYLHPQQSIKVRDETGLNWDLQKDLVRCHLDAEMAQLLYYSYRVEWYTRANGTIELVCAYLPVAQSALKSPDTPKNFWTPKRLKYRRVLVSLLQDIETQKKISLTEKTRGCIDDFLKYIKDGWNP